MKYLYILLAIFPFIIPFAGCSPSDADMRQPEDIMGVWIKDDNTYLDFSANNEVHKLITYNQDGETIGDWVLDVYFYEPGYDLVVYINGEAEGFVYKIVSLSDAAITWCLVDEIHTDGIHSDSIGQIIGDIINKAQDGYHLNPGLYETMVRMPYDKFLELLESLDIMYPWGGMM